MRTTRYLTVVATVAAAAITLTGCGDDATAPPTSTATSSGQTNTTDERAEAIKASKKSIEAGIERSGLEPYPTDLFTEQRIEEKAEQIARAEKKDQKMAGKLDEVLWMKVSSTALPRQVAMDVCVQRNERWLDAKGNDIRGNQDGEPVEVGSKAKLLIRTVPGDQDGTWLIDSIEEKGSCK